MTTYVATYTVGGVELQDDLSHYWIEGAYKEAKNRAKANGWKLISVKPKKEIPTPQVYQPYRREDTYNLSDTIR
jgi:hypothetical protein